MRATMNARLRQLGMNYQQYLASDHWKDVKRRYRASTMPQRCVGCGSPNFQLHHQSYQRLGREDLTDLVPLCGDCHRKFHEYEKTHSTHGNATHKILRNIFGWTKAEAKEQLKAFKNLSAPRVQQAKTPPDSPAILPLQCRSPASGRRVDERVMEARRRACSVAYEYLCEILRNDPPNGDPLDAELRSLAEEMRLRSQA